LPAAHDALMSKDFYTPVIQSPAVPVAMHEDSSQIQLHLPEGTSQRPNMYNIVDMIFATPKKEK